MKKIWIILIFVIILAIVAVVLVFNNSSSTFKKDYRDFAVNDTTSITRIFLSDKNNRNVLLERISPSEWRLNNTYRAQQESVDLFLKTIMNLAVLDAVSEAAHNTVVSLLATNSVKVEIYQKVYRIDLFNTIRLFPFEKRTKTYYVGHVAQNNIGTYMLLEDSPRPFLVYMPGLRGFVASRYRTVEEDWRDHTIFNIPLSDFRSVTVDFVDEPEKSYKIIKSNNQNFELIKINENKPVPLFDTLKVLKMVTSFKNIRFESFKNDIPSELRDSIIENYPAHVIRLGEVSGEEHVARTFYKPANPGAFDYKGDPVLYNRDHLYALINDGRDFTLIQYFVFDKITRPLNYFLVE